MKSLPPQHRPLPKPTGCSLTYPGSSATVQRRAIQEVLDSPGQSLPASARNLFGPQIDLSRVRLHTDARAISSADAVDARAYTLGHHVVFGRNEYAPESAASRSLLAHELAHVIQQGSSAFAAHAPVAFGRSSDPAEADAEAFARLALSPPSWERSGARQGSAPIVSVRDHQPTLRRKPKDSCSKQNTTWAGCFHAEDYRPTLEPSSDKSSKDMVYGANIDIHFTPNDKVDASKIGMIQTVQHTKGGLPSSIYFRDVTDTGDPDAGPRIVGTGSLNTDTDVRTDRGKRRRDTALGRMTDPTDLESPGNAIDNLPQNRSPLGGRGDPPKGGGGLADTTRTGWGDFGFHYFERGKLAQQEASLHDIPSTPVSDGVDASMTFETAALAVEGAQKGAFYGSVRWGWTKASSEKNASLIPFKLLHGGTPSAAFETAASQWNTTRTSANELPIAIPRAMEKFSAPKKAALLDAAGTGKKIADLDRNTRLQVVEGEDKAHKDWRQVIVVEGRFAGRPGWLRADALSDKRTEEAQPKK